MDGSPTAVTILHPTENRYRCLGASYRTFKEFLHRNEKPEKVGHVYAKVSFEVAFVAFATPKVSFEVTFVAFATPKVSFEVTFVAFATPKVSFEVTFVAFATPKVSFIAVAKSFRTQT
ncbi:MAG: hypothetical protein V7K89_23215 [Nostoc sp.]|uniref:hypothetical protein n=1 Tax=Nostoc sp. TaxID=1180 RepID=UPI002FF61724